MKLRSQITAKQENVLGSRDGELADVRERLRRSSEELVAAKEEVKVVRVKLEDRERRSSTR